MAKEVVIHQEIEFNITVKDENGSISLQQIGEKIFVEKRNIKLLMAQLILLDNGK